VEYISAGPERQFGFGGGGGGVSVGDPLFLHRLQFAFTIVYHYLFPVLTMGLALLIVVMKARGLRAQRLATG
jgi:hypothetical protein